MENVEKIKPTGLFTNYIYKTIPLAFDESMSYYETLCGLLAYLRDTVIPAVDNNADAIIEVQNLMKQLQDYVDNYFDNLDVQEEINNKLDEMVEDGTLAEIINQEIFGELDNRITQNTNDISSLETDIITHPYYDILKNGGYADGSTPNDTIFSNAKTNGYKKFYFSQNSTNNAEYYFTNYPIINDCEIKTDKGVIINVPNSYGNSSTNTSVLNTNIKFKFRTENKTQIISQNNSDMYNMLHMNFDYSIKLQNAPTTLASYKLFHWNNVGGSPTFLFEEDTPTDYYEVNDIFFNRKANTGNSYYSGLCLPIGENKNCIETCTNGNGTNPAFVLVESSTGKGYYIRYNGSNLTIYSYDSHDGTTKNRLNIFNHNQATTSSHNWQNPCKYKMKYDKIWNKVQLLFNDGIMADISLPFTPDYYGFGWHQANTDYKMTRFCNYYQENLPLNGNLNILIVGDSRFAGVGQTYKIDEILKNGLLYNGVNNVTIDNRAVSGYSMGQILNVIQSATLSDYDVVIVETGINNYNSTQNQIAYNMHDIDSALRNSGVLMIYTACMPCGWGASDQASDARAEKYYGIQNAIMVGLAANRTNEQIIIDNNCGDQSNASNTPVMPDGVHPNDNGLIEISRNIISGLLNHYKAY